MKQIGKEISRDRYVLKSLYGLLTLELYLLSIHCLH